MIAVEINNVGPACLFSTTHSHGNIWVFRSSGRQIFLGRSFSQPISIGLPSKQSEGSSNQHVAEQPSKPRNDSSNPRAEQRNPTERLRDPTEELRKQGTHEPAKDPLHLPSGPITIARAKKFNEVIYMLIQQVKINYKRLSALNLPI
jgi:hypothetical protein